MNEQNRTNLQIIETALHVYAFDDENAENLNEVNFEFYLEIFYKIFSLLILVC